MPEPFRPALVAPDLARFPAPDPARIQVTWVGHATFLLQFSVLNS